MITAEGWFDWAAGRDLPTDDRLDFFGGKRHAFEVVVHHSFEGWYSGPDYPSPHRNPARYPTCWHATVDLDGSLWQHAPIWLQTVHGHAANPRGPGIESEGVAAMPLNDAQVATWLRIHRDIEAFTGQEFERRLDYAKGVEGALIEHRQVGPTACPSKRYAPLWAAKEDSMPDAERELLLKLASIVAGGADGSEFLTVEDALEVIRPLENPGDQRLLLGQERLWGELAELDALVGDHETNHPGPALVRVPRHRHVTVPAETGPAISEE